MSIKSSNQEGKLGIKSAAVHFVYSFCLIESDSETEQHRYLLNRDTLITHAEKLKSKPDIFLKSNNPDDADVHLARIEGLEYGVPESRKGIPPHLEFITDEYHSINFSVRCIESSVNGLNYPQLSNLNSCITIDALVRLMPNSSTCSFSVTVPPSPLNTQSDEETCKVSTKDVHKLLQLIKSKGQEASSQPSLLFPSGAQITLYGLFKLIIEKICEPIEGGGTQLAWLETEGDKPMISLSSENQTPMVTSILEVDEHTAKAFCQSGSKGKDPAQAKMLEIQEYEEEIAPILFRAPKSNSDSIPGLMLEPSYMKSPTPLGVPGLFNMGVDARIYFNISRRSALCICEDANKPPADHFINDLLNLIEIIRARWHMLIIMNQVLDHSIRDFRSGIDDIEYEGNKLREMVRLREWLSTSLEDPGIYVVAGEFLSNLSNKLEKTFRIDELRQLVLGKLKLLEALYRDINEIKMLEMEKPIEFFSEDHFSK
ncbi:MAG: hypothetical protein ABW152_01380 [Candidatus Thiodiazotropha endolucinida]